MKEWLVQHEFSQVSSPDSESRRAHWQAWLWGKRKLPNISEAYRRTAFQIQHCPTSIRGCTWVKQLQNSLKSQINICRAKRAVQKYSKRAMRQLLICYILLWPNQSCRSDMVSFWLTDWPTQKPVQAPKHTYGSNSMLATFYEYNYVYIYIYVCVCCRFSLSLSSLSEIFFLLICVFCVCVKGLCKAKMSGNHPKDWVKIFDPPQLWDTWFYHWARLEFFHHCTPRLLFSFVPHCGSA